MRKDDVLGHERVGSGPRGIIALNDWMCDTTTWDGARAYLDGDRFTWVFADLRGYGRSRARTGAFTAEEGASDVLALADALSWPRFSIVGHSMSALVAVHLAQHHAERAARAVLLTPPPPAGFGAPDATLEQTRALAMADDAARLAYLGERFVRLSRGWTAFKAARWRETSEAEAVAAYAEMFLRRGVPQPAARITIPVLAITGAHDAPYMRHDAVQAAYAPICDSLEVTDLADSGHYPMQEVPPLTVALVEKFLA